MARPEFDSFADLQWNLPLFDELFLSMQGQNVMLVDLYLRDLERDLLRELLELEHTPFPATLIVSALSQMWIFAVYELLRTWRQRIRDLKRDTRKPAAPQVTHPHSDLAGLYYKNQLAHLRKKPKYAKELAAIGVRRVNVSMDTLDRTKFRELTRWGELDQVMRGLDAAQQAGLHVKINAVALRGVNDMEFDELIRFSHGRGMDLTLIEVMPMGEIGADARLDQYLPLSLARADIAKRFTLSETDYRTGGPARYFRVEETGGRLGFITPLTHNFCESCNRVRLTCTGTLYMCLGQEDAADLRAPLRASESDDLLDQAITAAIARKPKGHDLIIDRRHSGPAVPRHMSVTGG